MKNRLLLLGWIEKTILGCQNFEPPSWIIFFFGPKIYQHSGSINKKSHVFFFKSHTSLGILIFLLTNYEKIFWGISNLWTILKNPLLMRSFTIMWLPFEFLCRKLSMKARNWMTLPCLSILVPNQGQLSTHYKNYFGKFTSKKLWSSKDS